MANVEKDLSEFFRDEPPGMRCNAIRWLQKQAMHKAATLPRTFADRKQWESFREKIRRELPARVGLPRLPKLEESFVRGRIRLGSDLICERVDVFMDADYSMPALVISPAQKASKPRPAFVWSPGWSQDKWYPAYQAFAARMARKGYVALLMDHAPFGETTQYQVMEKKTHGMTGVMSLGNLCGFSQMAVRAAETMRAGEYLRSRPDVDPKRVAVAGLCQGGQDTVLAGALDEDFCAVAPLASASTFAVTAAEMSSHHVLSDASPFLFGVLDVCDADHLYAACAPRPLLVRANLGDCWWPISGFDDIESLARRVYKLYGAEGKMDFGAEVHEHNLTGPFADALEAFLVKYV